MLVLPVLVKGFGSDVELGGSPARRKDFSCRLLGGTGRILGLSRGFLCIVLGLS